MPYTQKYGKATYCLEEGKWLESVAEGCRCSYCRWTWRLDASATKDFSQTGQFLSEIPATMWQNCEQLKLGYATHFSMTNNVAESFGSQWAGSAFILCSRSNIPSNGSNLLVFLEVRWLWYTRMRWIKNDLQRAELTNLSLNICRERCSFVRAENNSAQGIVECAHRLFFSSSVSSAFLANIAIHRAAWKLWRESWINSWVFWGTEMWSSLNELIVSCKAKRKGLA